MFERKMTDSIYLTNGNGKHAVVRDEEPATIWRKIRINEQIFSWSLFLLSFSIFLAKLCSNYGVLPSWQIGDRYSLPSVPTLNQIYNTLDMSVLPKFDMKRLPANSEKFLNVSNQYAEAAANVLVTFYEEYGWLIKAMLSGLIIMGFTWFIIYKDSSIPGINPPSPFSPSRRRIYEGPRIQMNYFVAILNGILIFIYMCL